MEVGLGEGKRFQTREKQTENSKSIVYVVGGGGGGAVSWGGGMKLLYCSSWQRVGTQ